MSYRPTPRQQQVIDEEGNCLTVAGPGSGKTATMVQKIRHILAAQSTFVVAVTFTRDAANELQERISKAIDRKSMARLRVGTFHSLTLQHLADCRQKPRIITPAQQFQFLNRAIKPHQVDRSEAQQLFESAKCSLEPVPEIENLPWFMHYEQMLARSGMEDLHDVMRKSVLRMRDGSLPLLTCTHLIVDEYQDCDQVQYTWAALHTRKGVITTVVGDDDQTIYEWRRAIGYAGMCRFAEEANAAVISLGDNYRSFANIVSAADRLIAYNNPNRLRKDFVAQRGPGGHIFSIARGGSDDGIHAASEMIASNASPMPQYENSTTPLAVPTGSWAVLGRNNRLLQSAEAALTALGVRTYRSSGSILDTEYAQVFLGTIEAVQCADPAGIDLSMHHFGCAEDDIQTVLKRHSNALEQILDGEFVPSGLADSRRFEAFTLKTKIWRKFLRAGEFNSLFDRVSRFVVDSSEGRRQQLALLICTSIEQRLNRLQGSPVQRVRRIQSDRAKKVPQDAVCLYTMHGAKGLEFTNVVIVGMDDEVIPGDIERHESPTEVANVPSERRLFFVALTRAKERVWLVHTAGRGSRFLAELPQELMQGWNAS